MSAQDLISKFGKSVGNTEIQKLNRKYGDAGIAALESAGIRLKPGAQQWLDQYRSARAPAPEPPPAPIPNPQEVYAKGASIGGINMPSGSFSQEEYAGVLMGLSGQIEQERQKIVNQGIKDVADIEAGAAKYGYDRDLEAKRYLADQDLLKGTRVAEIEGQKRIDLQGVINAGLKEVEGIRGQTERDVATIGGEYGLKQEAERQRGSKDIARIGSEAGFRNALIGAFSF